MPCAAAPLVPTLEGMTSRLAPLAASLDAATCLHRLARSRAAYVACTTRAMPSVLPVRLRVREGTLLLGPVDPELAEQLDGQVVAVGAGRPPGVLRSGWQVVVRGSLSLAGEGSRMLVLDPRELEGCVLGTGGTA